MTILTPKHYFICYNQSLQFSYVPNELHYRFYLIRNENCWKVSNNCKSWELQLMMFCVKNACGLVPVHIGNFIKEFHVYTINFCNILHQMQKHVELFGVISLCGPPNQPSNMDFNGGKFLAGQISSRSTIPKPPPKFLEEFVDCFLLFIWRVKNIDCIPISKYTKNIYVGFKNEEYVSYGIKIKRNQRQNPPQSNLLLCLNNRNFSFLVFWLDLASLNQLPLAVSATLPLQRKISFFQNRLRYIFLVVGITNRTDLLLRTNANLELHT